LIAPSFVDALVTERISRLPMTEPAFLEFYARTAGRLHGYLRKLTGDPALAEDLLQEAYLRFLTRARGLDNDEHQKNYLFRIATNLARDHFRREQRRPLAHEAGISSLRDGSGEAGASFADDGGDVWAMLAQLSSRDRELLLLAYVEGMTHKEISHVTGLMRGSIKPLLFRARRRFAGVLTSAGLAPSFANGNGTRS
jgi:RNA polymerase sigma-70 factor (ECF subfamily)